MIASPDNTDHKSLEQTVNDFLTSAGFLTASATYHDVMPPELVRTLRNRRSMTAQSLRTRADRVAVHRSRPIEFEYECKTHLSDRYHDMTVEALPLALHVAKARYGVKCLYCYHNPHTGQELGFWVHDLPPIRELRMPEERWNAEETAWFRAVFSDAFPDVKVIESFSRGSGDPFAVIDEFTLSGLPDWRSLIAGAA